MSGKCWGKKVLMGFLMLLCVLGGMAGKAMPVHAEDESDYIAPTQQDGDLYWNINADGHLKIWMMLNWAKNMV